MTPNHLDWPALYNVRDLGGLPTRDGGAIGPGSLIRSDKHYRLTDDGIAAVRAANVSRIIDLRHARECEAEPSPFADDPIYRHVSVEDPAGPNDHDGLSLAEIYCLIIDRRPDLFAAAIAAAADAPPGAVVVHCAAGKDRTGLVVALLLSLAQVQADTIAADYALTEDRLRAPLEAYLDGLTDLVLRDRIAELSRTEPETMLRVLEHIDARHGGVSAYLEAAGCDLTVQESIRERLVVSAGSRNAEPT
jgi:protein-tyrosine phosphatase